MDENSKPSSAWSKIDSILTYLYYILFFFTPLIMFSRTSELFEFNKMIFIYLITTLIVFLWFLKIIFYKQIIINKTYFDIPILLFFISQLISTIFSIDRHTSIWGYYGRFNGGLLSLILYITLFYAFVSFLNNQEKIKEIIDKLLKISVISSSAVILWGLPGKFGFDMSCFVFLGQLNNNCWTDQFRPAERMFSTLGQPNWLGAYLAINFFIGLYFLFRQNQDRPFHKLLFFAYSILNFTSIIFTRSRSALLSAILGLLFFAFYLFAQKKQNPIAIKKFIYLTICLIVSILIFKTGISRIDQYLSLKFYSQLGIKKTINKQITSNKPLKNINSDVTESFDIRKIVWQGAINLGLKYPLFGTGVETFAYSYYFVRPKLHNLTSEWDYLYNKAHNEYLNYLATTGFVGLGTYVIFILAVCFYCVIQFKNQNVKLKKGEQLKSIVNNQLLIFCLFLSYLSILITNFFGFSTTTVNLYFYIIPALLILLSRTSLSKIYHLPSDVLSLTQKFYLIFISCLTIYALLSIFLYFLADIKYAVADSYIKTNDYQTAASLLNQALKLRNEHVYQDKLSYVLANLAYIAYYQKQSDLSKKLITLADSYNLKSLSASSKNVLYWKTRAKNSYLFYQITLNKKDIETGIETLKKAAELSPTDPKIPYSLSLFYSLLADEEKSQKELYNKLALEAISYSIYLKENYRDAYFLKGQLLKKDGRKEEAKKSFEIILNKIDPNDSEVKKELMNL